MSPVADRVVILDGSTELSRDVVGNKGASIARMLSLGLPVPPAFVLPIDECRQYHAAGEVLDDGVWSAVLGGLARIEQETGRRFGDPAGPLLVSVRSGAAVSMPGMMDTVLNLGVTPEVERGLAELSGDADFARRIHARFIHDYGRIVLGADIDEPEEDGDPEEVREHVRKDTGELVPTDPHEQLRGAIHAVFGSWSSRRAKAYRRHWGISDDGGTAVIVQAMVFGNLGEQSGTGVLFTRDPLSGKPEIYGEWLPGGQGEDVVSGTHDCLPLDELRATDADAHTKLIDAAKLLERENGDVQDIEFTVERGRLYLLQTRSAKRSPSAAVRTAVDLCTEGAITQDEVLTRVTYDQVVTVLAPRLSDEVKAAAEVLATGVAACPGVAAGVVVCDSEAAEAPEGDTVLARPTTSPEDVAGMIAARAVITEKGGSTSHAAVVTRALGRPSVVGVGEGVTDGWDGREVTVDGSAGVVYAGLLETHERHVSDFPPLATLAGWLEERSSVAVVDDAPDAVDLDAAGLDVEAEEAAITDALRGATAARGSVLATEKGARAVHAAGVTTVVRLPGQPAAALVLRLVQAQSQFPQEESQ